MDFIISLSTKSINNNSRKTKNKIRGIHTYPNDNKISKESKTTSEDNYRNLKFVSWLKINVRYAVHKYNPTDNMKMKAMNLDNNISLTICFPLVFFVKAYTEM